MGPEQAGRVFRLRPGLGSHRRLRPGLGSHRRLRLLLLVGGFGDFGGCFRRLLRGQDTGGRVDFGLEFAVSVPAMSMPISSINTKASPITTAAAPRAKFLVIWIRPSSVQCMGKVS